MRNSWIVVVLMTGLLLLAGIPQASACEGGYAFGEEAFYHALANCGGYDGRQSMCIEERYPCPVCVADAAKTYDEGQMAVERGGTIVNRFTDAFCEDENWVSEGLLGYAMDGTESGMEAYRWLCHYQNGEDLLKMAELLESGSVTELVCRCPNIGGYYPKERGGDRMLEMSRRHINGCWYQCFRAEDGSRIRAEKLNWSFSDIDAEIGHGRIWHQWNNVVSDVPQLSIDGGAGEEQLFFEERGNISVRVMREMDTYICVIREHDADPALLEAVNLHIAGSYLPIELNGYMDGTDGVYVTVLCEGEYRLIEGGAQAVLLHKDWSAGADYRGGEFAVVTYGTAGQCIIDREGNIRLNPSPDYQIERMPTANGGSMFCVWETGRSFKLLDGETLGFLAEYWESDRYISVESINASMYRTVRKDDDVAWYWSTEDCLQRFSADLSISFDASDFCHYQEGKPTRLVADEGNHKMYLTDLMGRKIAGTEYNNITPLVWNGNTGVYLVAVYDVPEDEWEDHYPNYSSEVQWYGTVFRDESGNGSWRCGLIDHNGNVLADAVYTEFVMISNHAAKLSDGENSIEVRF